MRAVGLRDHGMLADIQHERVRYSLRRHDAKRIPPGPGVARDLDAQPNPIERGLAAAARLRGGLSLGRLDRDRK